MLKRLFSRHISGEVRPMLALATPIILAEIGWMTMSIVDTMMVGRQADSSVAIAAVSLGGILYNAVAIFGTGLMLGLDTVVSHSYGAGDLDDAHRSLVNGVYLSLCMAPVAMGIIHLLELPMHSIGTDPAVLAQAVPYLRAVNWSSLPLLLYFVFRRYLQGIDLAKPVMFSLISANLINLAGNWALIYGHLGFHAMGTVGSGWSTCVARIYMASFLMVYCLYYDLRYKMGLLNASRWPNFPRVWKLVTLGFPAAAQLGLEVAVFVVVTALIARLGAVALASHQIALNTVSFTYMIPLGLGGAAAVRVGQAFGRRDPHAASRAGWTAMLLGAIFMTCMALILWLLPAYIVRIYTPDPVVIHGETKLLFVAAFFQLFDGLQAVATGALRGAGDTRTPMILSASIYWLIGVPLGAYLCFQRSWGASGLWSGLSISLILIGSVLVYVWHRKSHSFAAAAAAPAP
ncbi:MAG: MATE family efflux transporter [Candidatus Acidiferrales bacterium]